MGLAQQYVNRVKYRLHHFNKNWLAIICGETGSGKSYSALSLAEDIGRVFIVFNALEFMKLLNSGSVKKGDVIIFDEAGVGLSARDWYTIQNKILGSVLQTFRNMNIAVIFTTPNLSFIDVQARKLFHSYLETKFIDRDKKVSWLKPYDIQVNSRLDKVYYKSPRFEVEGKEVSLNHIGVSLPSPELVKRYEEMKTEYTKKLNENALKELNGDNNKDKGKKEFNLDEEVKWALDHKEEVTNSRGKWSPELLVAKRGSTFQNARIVVQVLRSMKTP